MLPLTATTITDEQIRELYREAVDRNDRHTQEACSAALTRRLPARFDSRAMARARCAEILNARAALDHAGVSLQLQRRVNEMVDDERAERDVCADSEAV